MAYVILIDRRDDGAGIELAVDKDGNTVIDDIADAFEIAKDGSPCSNYPCEIININDLGWGD